MDENGSEYFCSKLGDIVKIDSEILIRCDSMFDKKRLKSFYCNHQSQCGIETGHGTGYDWAKCQHPLHSKQ
jgi:hypothetical protein